MIEASEANEKIGTIGRARAIGAAEVSCGACGSREVTADVVEHRGWLWIAECHHCDHRWTRPFEPIVEAARRPAMRVQPARQAVEVASAA